MADVGSCGREWDGCREPDFTCAERKISAKNAGDFSVAKGWLDLSFSFCAAT
jgi:hypothetical protein